MISVHSVGEIPTKGLGVTLDRAGESYRGTVLLILPEHMRFTPSFFDTGMFYMLSEVSVGQALRLR